MQCHVSAYMVIIVFNITAISRMLQSITELCFVLRHYNLIKVILCYKIL